MATSTSAPQSASPTASSTGARSVLAPSSLKRQLELTWDDAWARFCVFSLACPTVIRRGGNELPLATLEALDAGVSAAKGSKDSKDSSTKIASVDEAGRPSGALDLVNGYTGPVSSLVTWISIWMSNARREFVEGHLEYGGATVFEDLIAPYWDALDTLPGTWVQGDPLKFVGSAPNPPFPLNNEAPCASTVALKATTMWKEVEGPWIAFCKKSVTQGLMGGPNRGINTGLLSHPGGAALFLCQGGFKNADIDADMDEFRGPAVVHREPFGDLNLRTWTRIKSNRFGAGDCIGNIATNVDAVVDQRLGFLVARLGLCLKVVNPGTGGAGDQTLLHYVPLHYPAVDVFDAVKSMMLAPCLTKSASENASAAEAFETEYYDTKGGLAEVPVKYWINWAKVRGLEVYGRLVLWAPVGNVDDRVNLGGSLLIEPEWFDASSDQSPPTWLVRTMLAGTGLDMERDLAPLFDLVRSTSVDVAFVDGSARKCFETSAYGALFTISSGSGTVTNLEPLSGSRASASGHDDSNGWDLLDVAHQAQRGQVYEYLTRLRVEADEMAFFKNAPQRRRTKALSAAQTEAFVERLSLMHVGADVHPAGFWPLGPDDSPLLKWSYGDEGSAYRDEGYAYQIIQEVTGLPGRVITTVGPETEMPNGRGIPHVQKAVRNGQLVLVLPRLAFDIQSLWLEASRRWRGTTSKTLKFKVVCPDWFCGGANGGVKSVTRTTPFVGNTKVHCVEFNNVDHGSCGHTPESARNLFPGGTTPAGFSVVAPLLDPNPDGATRRYWDANLCPSLGDTRNGCAVKRSRRVRYGTSVASAEHWDGLLDGFGLNSPLYVIFDDVSLEPSDLKDCAFYVKKWAYGSARAFDEAVAASVASTSSGDDSGNGLET